MTARQMVQKAEERCAIRLSDAMAEVAEDGDGDGSPLARRYLSTRQRGGIRLQRCGGGWRVIRKHRRAD